jgi:hypothetical protein
LSAGKPLSLILVLYVFALRKVVARLAALQAVKAAIVHQPDIMLAIAEIAVLVALASLFHFFANHASESLSHGRTLTLILSSCNSRPLALPAHFPAC